MVGRLLFVLCVVALPLSLYLSFVLTGPLAWLAGLLYILYDTVLLAFVARRILRVLREPPTAKPARRISLAVLVAARNEADGILPCLRALRAQTEPADSVLVVDDGSTDATAAIARAEGFAVFSKAHSGKADSLNQAWPGLGEDIVVTLDADTVLAPDALGAIRDAFGADPELAAAGGVLTPTCAGRGWRARLFQGFQRFEYIRAFLSRRAWMSSDALVLVSGAFGAYRRSALAEAGGYDTTSLVEDYDLVHRIHRYAFEHGVRRRVGVLIAARATTDSPSGVRAFLRQRQRWFAGFLQTHFHCWDMVGNPRYGNVGKLMLPIKSLDTLQPLFGLLALFTLICMLVVHVHLHPLVIAVLVAKLTLDLGFHFWSLALYARWSGTTVSLGDWARAALASIFEPFTFQPLRHLGATLGWILLVRREHEWTRAAPAITPRG